MKQSRTHKNATYRSTGLTRRLLNRAFVLLLGRRTRQRRLSVPYLAQSRDQKYAAANVKCLNVPQIAFSSLIRGLIQLDGLNPSI
jgi:hypothetical protein